MIGVLLLVLGMLEGFTGYLLPWDQTAYWATVVGINLNATAPIRRAVPRPVPAGRARASSPDTLSKFYALHMLLIPGAIMALIGLHLYLVVRLGVTSPPWSKTRPGARARRGDAARARASSASPRPEAASRGEASALQGTQPRRASSATRRTSEGGEAVLPVRDAPRHDHVARRRRGDHRARDHLEVHRRTAPTRAYSARWYTDKADPATTNFVPRPDWFFYFLFYLLRIFKWPETVVLGTVGIPTMLLILLIGLPFYDRRPERRIARRPVAVVAAILVVISMGVLTWKGATAKEALGSELIAAGCPRVGRGAGLRRQPGRGPGREAVRRVGLPELPHVPRRGQREPRRPGSERRRRLRQRGSSSSSRTSRTRRSTGTT